MVKSDRRTRSREGESIPEKKIRVKKRIKCRIFSEKRETGNHVQKARTDQRMRASSAGGDNGHEGDDDGGRAVAHCDG
ncbi:electron transport complex subunit RsxC [Sesbania bispinosa]|nr:electron transport complex subunit RsxC [Sesbania bispinosa]